MLKTNWLGKVLEMLMHLKIIASLPWQDSPFLYVCNIRHSSRVCSLHPGLSKNYDAFSILFEMYSIVSSPGWLTQPLASLDSTAAPSNMIQLQQFAKSVSSVNAELHMHLFVEEKKTRL